MSRRRKGPSRPKAPAASSAPKGTMVVNGYATRWIRKGFPWVHPNEVVSGARGEVGEPVRVLDGQGKLLGRGLRDRGFLAARIYRHDDGELDDAWLASVVDRAIAMRRRIVDDQTTAWRLLHGENDGIPGLRVDHWAGHLTIVMDSPAVAPLLARIVPVLVERLQPASIWSCYRPDPRDERDVSGFRPEPGCLAGACEADVEVHERGMAMGVRPWEGPDTGVYTDMREVRRWLEPYWAGRRVVNTFAYTGAFSVAAARGGASEVVTVDLGKPALERAKDNFRRNGLPVDDDAFVAEDTFRALDRFRRKQRRFDIAVVDPPSFSHGPAGTWSVTKDMPRLVASTARVLDTGGWLVLASNHGQTSPKAFRGMVADGLARAGRVGSEVAWLGPAPDHPARVGFPEAHYLKVGVWALD